jgi:DNA repair ATPase RecN
MLSFLAIRNLAVVEKVDLEFPGGFSAVTGETGAGKSVLLGALALLAGARADREAIRAGAQDLTVERPACSLRESGRRSWTPSSPLTNYLPARRASSFCGARCTARGRGGSS